MKWYSYIHSILSPQTDPSSFPLRKPQLLWHAADQDAERAPLRTGSNALRVVATMPGDMESDGSDGCCHVLRDFRLKTIQDIHRLLHGAIASYSAAMKGDLRKDYQCTPSASWFPGRKGSENGDPKSSLVFHWTNSLHLQGSRWTVLNFKWIDGNWQFIFSLPLMMDRYFKP